MRLDRGFQRKVVPRTSWDFRDFLDVYEAFYEGAAGADAEADAGAKAVGLRLGLRLRLGLPWEIGLFPPTRG